MPNDKQNKQPKELQEKPSNTAVRVRYAPSPTGLQHIGGVRTALFNYLFARSQGGQFILRIEDTDRARSKPEYIQDLYDSLQWLGIDVDEGPAQGGDFGPYIQSERVELYRQHVQQLLDEGKAYYCFCKPERLEQLRKEQERSKSPLQGYDRHCRGLDPQEARLRAQSEAEPSVVRFALPLEGSTQFYDLLLGDIERANRDINPDPIILKADGFPTYHLANVIDDHSMQISHVLRAQEWLSSGPLHILLYRAFGWQAPQFCHLPMVMGQDGAKLSKRHGSTSLIEFRKQGYLPEAIVNYIALLGWAYDDSREFFRLRELEELFRPEKLSRSPATFDYQKLEWFNGQYIRQYSVLELKTALQDKWQQALAPNIIAAPEFARSLDWILPLLQERMKTLDDAPAMAAYFFTQPDYSALLEQPKLAVPKKLQPDNALKILELAKTVLQELCAAPQKAQAVQAADWQSFEDLLSLKQDWEAAFRSAAERENIKMGALMQPLRFAVTGSNASPPLLESMIILQRLHGLQELLQRMDCVAELLQQLAAKL